VLDAQRHFPYICSKVTSVTHIFHGRTRTQDLRRFRSDVYQELERLCEIFDKLAVIHYECSKELRRIAAESTKSREESKLVESLETSSTTEHDPITRLNVAIDALRDAIADLRARSSVFPEVVYTHIPLYTHSDL
jgi:hypothetical protein